MAGAAQKPDLGNQRKVLEESVVAKGLANVVFVEEVGGGLACKRRRFVALMDPIGRREVKGWILACRDRLTRFGFGWLEHDVRANGCDVLVLNQERLSPERGMVEDLMTVVHCFSSRLDGLRNFRKNLDEALNTCPRIPLPRPA
ncbi:recombinase family protein [Thiomonas sp. FB-Cd]|uniref:recombinase family protein n=1 Tax=Thiomonas sp. FB-Cd TaxID=1158292 RepID=UPI000AB64057|nr:recombinase family protein [Thiomonas sp. FB-Cd]